MAVIILLTKGNTVRDFMLAAYDLDMHLNGEYTFLAVELIKAKKSDAVEWFVRINLQFNLNSRHWLDANIELGTNMATNAIEMPNSCSKVWSSFPFAFRSLRNTKTSFTKWPNELETNLKLIFRSMTYVFFLWKCLLFLLFHSTFLCKILCD